MSPRARVIALTTVAAIVAAAIAVLVSHGQRKEAAGAGRDTLPRVLAGAPPIALDLGVRTDEEAQALRRAVAFYDEDKRAAAKQVFDRYASLEARVGQSLAAWPDRSLDRLEQLGGLHASSPVVQLHLGLARIWSRRTNGEEALRAVIDVAPDTRYAVTAGNLLFPEYLTDLPLFLPEAPAPRAISGLSPPRQLRVLRRLAAAGDRSGALYYGVALLRLGRADSAERVFLALARRAPADAEARTAAAFGRFDKQRPVEAFSRLGPLTRRFPQAATVRFHLGLLLLWSKQLPEARRQLRLAVRAEPESVVGREANRYLSAIRNAEG